MDISIEISVDIVKYLQEKKGQSIKDISKKMLTTPEHIQEIINKKSTLKSEHIHNLLQNSNLRFWQFVSEAILMEHLTQKTREKIQICKKLTDRLKKKKIKNCLKVKALFVIIHLIIN